MSLYFSNLGIDILGQSNIDLNVEFYNSISKVPNKG